MRHAPTPRLAPLLLTVSLLWPSLLRSQVAIPREPVYTLDGRAIVGANRVMRKTRFVRRASSSIPAQLARAAARGDKAALPQYERFFRARLAAFLRAAPGNGIRTDDAGDARAFFIQVAFKVYNGQGFDDPREAFAGPGLWGEGAIAGMARASATLARLEFIQRVKFVMGSNTRFAGLSDARKQAVYDFYAVSSTLLIDGYRAPRAKDARRLASLRKQARQQLEADLGFEPDRVRFRPWGIEVD